MAQYEKLINLSLLNQFLTKAKTIFAPKITASGILKGDGNGGVSAATAGTDYATPALVKVSDTQPTEAENKLWVDTNAGSGNSYQVPTVAESLAMGMSGAKIGDLVRVNAVDSNGKPTSWKRVPLNEIKTQKNYLDNAYFKNAVNQRGQSSYTNAGYTIDRWKLISGSVSIGTNGLTLNGEIAQILENQIGQPVICSALLANGSIMAPAYDDSTKTFTLTATGETIIAVKLELGSEQTLAHNEGTEESPAWVLNEIPDYGVELLRCISSHADTSNNFANKDYASAIKVCPRISSGDDLDNYHYVYQAGTYLVGTGINNSPENWSTILVIPSPTGACKQIAFSASKIYVRSYGGSPLAWSAWKSITLS